MKKKEEPLKVTEEMLRKNDGYIHLSNGCSIVRTETLRNKEELIDWERLRKIMQKGHRLYIKAGMYGEFNLLNFIIQEMEHDQSWVKNK